MSTPPNALFDDSQEQWLEVVKRRYKFASFGSQQPESDDADEQEGEAE